MLRKKIELQIRREAESNLIEALNFRNVDHPKELEAELEKLGRMPFTTYIKAADKGIISYDDLFFHYTVEAAVGIVTKKMMKTGEVKTRKVVWRSPEEKREISVDDIVDESDFPLLAPPKSLTLEFGVGGDAVDYQCELKAYSLLGRMYHEPAAAIEKKALRIEDRVSEFYQSESK